MSQEMSSSEMHIELPDGAEVSVIFRDGAEMKLAPLLDITQLKVVMPPHDS